MGMEINKELREGMGMCLFTTMGTVWEWEYGHRNEREWDRKSHPAHLYSSFIG